MSAPALYELVCTRFKQSFGEPNHALDDATQWSLTSARGGMVHVLISRTATHASVWIFDFNIPNGESPVTLITSPDQIDSVILHARKLLESADAPALLSRHSTVQRHYPVRIEGFIRSVKGWSEHMTNRKPDWARIETEKVRMFGNFLCDDHQFTRAYQQNLSAAHRSVDCRQSLESMCSMLNAVADTVRSGPPGSSWST